MRRPPSARRPSAWLRRPLLGLDALEDRTQPAALTVTIDRTELLEQAGANAAVGTVTRTDFPLTQALAVTLASSDTTELVVQGSVIIPAGQASATFWVSATDDSVADGPQTATVTATATAPGPGFGGPISYDTNWGSGGWVSGFPKGRVAVQPDGKMLVAGTSGTPGVGTDFVVRRYNANGASDSTFGNNGSAYASTSGPANQPEAVLVQPDGKIVLAGTGGAAGQPGTMVLARLLPNGAADGTFGVNGVARLNFGTNAPVAAALTDAALQADGKIVLSGTVGGAFAVVRVTAAGAPDATFDGDGVATTTFSTSNSRATAVAVGANGTIVAAGHTNDGLASKFVLVRYAADGTPDAAFNGTGKVESTLAYANQASPDVAVQADGKIVLAGAVRTITGGTATDFAAVRYTAAGALDPSFGTAGVVYEAAATTAAAAPVRVLLQPEGRIVVAGTTGSAGSAYGRIVRLSPAGAVETRVDTTWASSVTQSIAQDANGNLYLAYAYGSGGTSGYVDRFRSPAGTAVTGQTRLTVLDNEPFSAAADAYTVAEDTALTVGAAAGVRANDTVTAPRSVTAEVYISPDAGTLVLNADGSFTYTPRPNFFGADRFRYLLRDGSATTNIATVSLTVVGTSDAPIAGDDAYTVAEDGVLSPSAAPVGTTALTMVSEAGDSIGRGLTYNLSPATGTFTLTGDTTYLSIAYRNLTAPGDFWWLDFRSPYSDVPLAVGTYRNAERAAFRTIGRPGLDVSGQGRGSNRVTGEFTVLQIEANAAGQVTRFAADFEQHSEGRTPALRGSIRFNADPAGSNLLANDSDADGTPLTAMLVSGPSHGQLSLDPNGTFTYTPAANYHGPDSFTYRATDGTLVSNVATVNLTVTPGNDAPTTVDDVASTAEDTPAVIDVLANDVDREGLPLTAVVVSQPKNGTAAVNAAGRVVYTPRADFFGADSFTYRAASSEGPGNAATVTVTVTPVNDAPFPGADVYEMFQGGSRTVGGSGVLANDYDADGDPLTAVLVAGPTNGTLTLNPNGSFTYVPNPAFFGVDTFTYAAVDPTGRSDTEVVRLTVARANKPPVGVADAVTTAEDTPVAIDVVANDTDADGDPLATFAVTQPAHGIIGTGDPRGVVYFPAHNFFGTDTFTYRVFDGLAYSDPVTVTITVTPVNDAPVGTPDARTATEDYTHNIPAAALLANDTDPEQDVLSLGGYTQPAHGTLTPGVGFDGLVYRPNPNFNGTDTFTYWPSDGRRFGTAVTVTLAVDARYDRPVGVADAHAVAEDGVLVVPAAGVLANDTNIDGRPLTAVLVYRPTNGTLSLSPDGGFTYTPRPNFVGTDTFTYYPSDGTVIAGDQATATITVTQVNDAPVAVPDAYTLAENGALTVVPAGPILDQQSLASVHGFDVGAAGAEWQQGVTAGAAGVLTSIDLFVADGVGGAFDVFVNRGYPWQTDAADFVTRLTVTPAMVGQWVTIDVSAANIALVAEELFTIGTRNGSGVAARLGVGFDRPTGRYPGGELWYNGRIHYVTASGGGTYDLMFRTRLQTPGGVLANDRDRDSPVLTAVLVSGPANGTLTLAANGGFTYTPNPNFSDTDTFTYRVNDGAADSEPVTVTITVTSVNNAPAGVADAYAVAEDGTLTVAAGGVLDNDADADGDPLTAVRGAAPVNGDLVLNADGTFAYTPDPDFFGTDTFTYRPFDGRTLGSPVVVTIVVAPVADPPRGGNDALTTAEDVRLIFLAADLTANDQDPDRTPVTVADVTQPENGTLALGWLPTLGYEYRPAPNFFGTDTFTYRPFDGQLYGDPVTVTITVTPVNDPPVGRPDAYAVTEDGTLVAGGPVLDQQSLGEGARINLGIPNYERQQGVRAGMAGVLASFDLFVVGGAGAVFDVFVNRGTPWQTDAHAFVTRVTVTPAMVGQWVTIDTAAAGIVLAAGEDFVIGVRTDWTSSGAPTALLASIDWPTPSYPHGRLWSDGQPAVTGGNERAGYDLAFRTRMFARSVLSNDTDPDSYPITAALVAGPAHGTLTLAAGGGFHYTPHANFSGVDTFTYRVNDWAAVSDPVTVTITVVPVNDPPTAAADSFALPEDTSATFAVLANDADADGDSLAVIGVGPAAHGTVAFSPTGVTYTPEADYAGPDSFTYTVADGRGGTATATVSVFVSAVNDAPVALGLAAVSLAEDAAATPVPLAGGFADAEGGAAGLTYEVVGNTNAALFSAVSLSGGTLLLTPAADASGAATLTIRATDAGGRSVDTPLAVTVTPVNDAPAFTPGGDQAVTAGSGPKTVAGWATAISRGPADEAGQGLAFLVATTNPGLFVVPPAVDPATGTLTFIPEGGVAGTATVTVALRDTGGGTDTSAARTFTVTVAGNGLPAAAGARKVGFDLIVTGGDTADAIAFSKIGSHVRVDATLAGTPATYLFANVTRIVVDARGGNDTITFASTLTLPTWIDAGDGNDAVTGGSGADEIYLGAGDDTADGGGGNDFIAGGAGADVIQGGAGGDTIYAGDGNDFVVGGPDVDQLFGQAGHDLVAGGSAAVRTPAADSLRRVLADWDPTRPGVYADLRPRLQVTDDNAADRLTGGPGTDWFWAGVPDAIDDQEPDEQRD